MQHPGFLPVPVNESLKFIFLHYEEEIKQRNTPVSPNLVLPLTSEQAFLEVFSHIPVSLKIHRNTQKI